MQEFIEKVTAMLKTAGLNHKYVKDVFEDSAKNKHKLNEIMGLNPDNFYRMSLSIELTDAEFNRLYSYVKQVFEQIPGWQAPFKPTTGKIQVGKDQVNITKFLSKALADGKVPEDYKQHLMQRLGIDRANPKAEAQIVPKLGELLNKKDDNVVIVSTNPFDFFTSSAGDFKYAAFKSCYRPGGEYFNGCNSLARDNFSMISYKANTKQPDYKHGRAWMFVLDKIVAQTKSYGTFTENERRVARDYAMKCIAEKEAFDPAEYAHHKVEHWNKASRKNVLYFDNYAIDLGYPKSKHPKGFTDNNVPHIIFSDAKCLKCGRETQYPTQGICGVCSGSYKACHGCGAELYNERGNSVNGHTYCKECTEKRFDRCEIGDHYAAKGSLVEVNGERVCPECMARYFYKCDHCGNYHKKNQKILHTVTGETWCDTCFKKDGFLCKDCGEKHPKTVAQEVVLAGNNKIIVCKTCAATYAVCAKCRIMHKDGLETADGIVCSACAPGYEFCTECAHWVLREKMVFDGKVISCSDCALKRNVTKATSGMYIAEIERIVAEVKAAEVEKLGNAAAIMLKLKEDREKNGYQDGDIVRIIGDSSYHEYKPGALVTVCSKFTQNGITAYCTFRDDTEWFVKESDIEFARPAIVPGDTVTYKNTPILVTDVLRNENTSLVYVYGVKDKVKAELCTPTDVVDPKALAQLAYKVNEIVEIVGNTSNHGFKEGDRVRILDVATQNEMTRYVVRKGTRFGIVWGSVMDIQRSAEKGADAPPIKKTPAKKKVAPPM